MNKDISKIITKGSPRQRIVLLATDSMQEYIAEKGIKPEAKKLLTEAERENLLSSFKTPQEVRYYNKHAQLNRDIPYLIMILSETQLEYEKAIAHLNGFCLSLTDYQFTVSLFNNILDEIKDKNLKNKIKKTILNSSPFVYAKLEADKKGGLIKLVTEYENKSDFMTLMKIWNRRATATLQRAKSYIKATRDYLEGEDFLIKSFKDILNFFEKAFQEDRALIGKYSKRKMNKLSEEYGEKITNLTEKYFMFPDYDELEINEDDYNSIMEGIKK